MKYLAYHLRWQLAGLMLYTWTIPLLGPVLGTITGNAIGALVFWWVDKWLTKTEEQ